MCTFNFLTVAGVGILLCQQTSARGVDISRLKIQKWATATHIYWVRPIAPDRVAISYFNSSAGLDVVDSSGTVVRRVWPLPPYTYCAAVYPDGQLFLRQDGTDWNPDMPAAVRADGSVVVLAARAARPLLMVFDSATTNGRTFALGVFDTDRSSRIYGIEAQPDGKILVWGELWLADGRSTNFSRINLDETLDSSFQPTLPGWVRNVRTAPNETILVETLDTVASSERMEWIRLNSDGTVRSSLAMTFPEGTSPEATAMLDDGSVVLSEEGGARLRRISPDGSSSTRDAIGFWSTDWGVSDLIPIGGGQLVIVQGATCQGGGCWAQDWVRILPNETSGGQMVMWVPPSPNYGGAPMLFVENLSPESDYVVEASTDFRAWQTLSGFQRSSDRLSAFLRDSEALGLNLGQRFYRMRKLD